MILIPIWFHPLGKMTRHSPSPAEAGLNEDIR